MIERRTRFVPHPPGKTPGNCLLERSGHFSRVTAIPSRSALISEISKHDRRPGIAKLHDLLLFMFLPVANCASAKLSRDRGSISGTC